MTTPEQILAQYKDHTESLAIYLKSRKAEELTREEFEAQMPQLLVDWINYSTKQMHRLMEEPVINWMFDSVCEEVKNK